MARRPRAERRAARRPRARRSYRHPRGPRRAFGAQPPARVRAQAGAGASHVSRVLQHDGRRRHRLPIDGPFSRPARRRRATTRSLRFACRAAIGAIRRRPSAIAPRRSAAPGRRRSVASTISPKSPTPRCRCGSRLLRRVPEARLLLYARGESHRERVRAALRRAGVEESRVSFVGRQSLQDYLETYRDIDVALDPFPYGGRHDDVRCAVDGRAGRQPGGPHGRLARGLDVAYECGLRARRAERGAVPRACGRACCATARDSRRCAPGCASALRLRP